MRHTTIQRLSRRTAVAVVVLFHVSQARPLAGQTEPTWQVVNVAQRFVEFIDRRGICSANWRAQAAAFRREVVADDSPFFRKSVGDLSDERVDAFLCSARHDTAQIRRVTALIPVALPPAIARMRRVLPDFEFKGPIYVYPSFFVRDGGFSDFGVDSVPTFMLGVDMIARLHGSAPDPMSVLLHHEMFHLYHFAHARAPAGRTPFYVNVWREGLATYASQELNPGAGLVDAFLHDSTLVSVPAARLSQLATKLLLLLDTTDQLVTRPWLTPSGTADVPGRSAYLLGYHVAASLGCDRSLSQLARLDFSVVREELTRILRAIGQGADVKQCHGRDVL